MSRATKAFHRILRGTRARTVLTVVLGVLLATTGLVGGAVQVLRASAEPMPTPPTSPQQTSSTPLVQRTEAAPAAVIDPAGDVRRERVGGPSDFPGSLGSAPPDAVAAYQRAAVIMATASDCRLDWTVLAAVGRVESDHGRGPAVGAPLDGRRGRGQLPDTDLGMIDRDDRWDAPVGPLRLMPATWANVAVDADDDGTRDPQDIDDAALGAAVLLCSGGGDLGRLRDLVPALSAYHPGEGFVRTVLVLMRRYEKQAAQMPAPLPPEGPLPVLPDLCGCATVRARGISSTAGADVRWDPVRAGADATRPTDEPTGPIDPTTEPTDATTEPTDATTDPTDPTDPADPSSATTSSSDHVVLP